MEIANGKKFLQRHFCYRQEGFTLLYLCVMEIVLNGEHFILSHHKTIFWKEKKTLLLADLHLTKENHFRKHGIAVPAGITTATLKKLAEAVTEFSPVEVIFLGDLFHSDLNKGIEEFATWKEQFKHIRFTLVEGNHDVLKKTIYESLQIEYIKKELLIDDFLLTHEPSLRSHKINFCGHIHPSITLHGKARQSLRLPCFYFNQTNFILPAFGKFTGSYSMPQKKGDKVYAVADGGIVEVR